MNPYRIVLVAAIVTTACGGRETPPSETPDEPAPAPAPAGPAAPAGALSEPDWYVVDHDARTVALTVTAGATSDNNYWNFNGYVGGEVAITVPEGYTVSIELINRDPNMAHSLGISSKVGDFGIPPVPDPVFPGAITEHPQSMLEATMPGESETITFVAETAGSYSMVCYIPGHTAVGMWLFFDVSGEGEAGVRGV